MTLRLPSPRIARAPLHRTPETIAAAPGAYILLIDLAAPADGAQRGERWRLPAGRYLYCGSARGPGGLKARIARHMRAHKTIHWHIDHLTARAAASAAWVFPGGDECALAAALAHLPVPIPGFGSSDCARCCAHLFAWPENPPLLRRSPACRRWRNASGSG